MSGSAIKVSDDGSRYLTSGGIGPMFANIHRYLLRIPGASGYGGYSTSTQVLSKWDGTGKVAIVTGAGGGLGFESARALASRGCEVVVTARDQAKAAATVAKLKELLPGTPLLVPLALDLSDLSSVKAFAENFLALKKPLNILLNNAGVMALPKYTPTKDGHESQLGVNHFAHFVLTNSLLPHMIETAKSSGVEGRIVCTASSAHHIPYKEGIRLQGYDDPSKYEAWGAYGQSKLANILLVRELALRLKKQDAPVVAYALHPGGISTDLQRDMTIFGKIFMLLARPLLKSVPQGAATQLFAATAPAGWAPSGEYLVDCNVFPSSAHSHNRTLGVGLWNLTETVTGVKGVV